MTICCCGGSGWWPCPRSRRDLARRFDFVLVDEYQDTNAIQAAILQRIKPDGRGVTVVGDDAQAIYGFRAATVRNILDFPQPLPPPAEIVTLEQNYRSTQPILAAANAVIGLAREGYRKELFSTRRSAQRPRLVMVRDDLAQAEHIATEVLANREAGLALRDQAVLFRTASHSAALELELARRNIPYVKFGGLRFFEAAHVKDVLAMLRWAENPRDPVAAFRVLQLLPGIGPAIARRPSTRSPAAARPRRREAARSGCRAWPKLGGAAVRAWGTAPWAASSAWSGRSTSRCSTSATSFAASRRADLDQLERMAATVPGRERFLTELTLDPPCAAGGPAGPPHKDED